MATPAWAGKADLDLPKLDPEGQWRTIAMGAVMTG